MHSSAVLGFVAASLAVIVVPGPSVLFAVSRAMAAGRRNALLTVLGNATGVLVQVVFIAFGLGTVVTSSELTYTLLKLVGSAYLMWLGIDAMWHRHDRARVVDASAPMPTATPWREGFVVGLTNPKTVVFLVALLPRSVDPGAGLVAGQMVALGGLFCLIAIVSDGAWALLAARARSWLSSDPGRLAWASVGGGLVMVGLGLMLLLG
jgi:threonine/homoserine/homoserine lactone efflux protein